MINRAAATAAAVVAAFGHGDDTTSTSSRAQKSSTVLISRPASTFEIVRCDREDGACCKCNRHFDINTVLYRNKSLHHPIYDEDVCLLCKEVHNLICEVIAVTEVYPMLECMTCGRCNDPGSIMMNGVSEVLCVEQLSDDGTSKYVPLCFKCLHGGVQKRSQRPLYTIPNLPVNPIAMRPVKFPILDHDDEILLFFPKGTTFVLHGRIFHRCYVCKLMVCSNIAFSTDDLSKAPFICCHACQSEHPELFYVPPEILKMIKPHIEKMQEQQNQ